MGTATPLWEDRLPRQSTSGSGYLLLFNIYCLLSPYFSPKLLKSNGKVKSNLWNYGPITLISHSSSYRIDIYVIIAGNRTATIRIKVLFDISSTQHSNNNVYSITRTRPAVHKFPRKSIHSIDLSFLFHFQRRKAPDEWIWIEFKCDWESAISYADRSLFRIVSLTLRWQPQEHQRIRWTSGNSEISRTASNSKFTHISAIHGDWRAEFYVFIKPSCCVLCVCVCAMCIQCIFASRITDSTD